MGHVAFRALFTALRKAELRRVFTIMFEINALLIPKASHSVATQY